MNGVASPPIRPVINPSGTTNMAARKNRRSVFGIANVSTQFVPNPGNTTNPSTAATTIPPQATTVNDNARALMSAISTRRRGNRSSIYSAASSGQICETPGCVSPVFVSQNGVAGKYCTNSHRQCVPLSSNLILPRYGVLNNA